MKRLVFVAMVAVGAVNALAMPTKAELTKAQPLVAELMAPAMAEFKAAGAKDKTAAAVKVADTSAAFANSAETEAAKFLLLKGAVNFYTRGEQYDKAADTVAALQAGVKDVPPDVIAEITGKATGKISETKAPRLFVQYRAAKLQVRAANEAKTLAKKLKTVKSDALQRRYAEVLAVSGDWKMAYSEFAKLNDAKLKAVVESEAKGQAKNAESGEFWWSYEPSLEDADDFFKSHAAKYYRQALAAGEITGLKKNIVEQRVAGIVVESAPGKQFASRSVEQTFSNGKKTCQEEARTREVSEYAESAGETKFADSEQEGSDASQKSNGKSKQILTGTQTEEEVVLDAGRYVLKSVYTVKKDQVLVLNKGVTIVGEPNAKLSVCGKMIVSGEEGNPVVFTGRKWGGITFSSSTGSSFEWAVVTQSVGDGVKIAGCCVEFDTTAIAYCGNGVALADRAKCIMRNSIVVWNKYNGFVDRISNEKIEQCSICYNGEWAYKGDYYGGPNFDKCVISFNKAGGITSGTTYDAFYEGHASIIADNRGPAVVHNGSKDWDFSGNWWGLNDTKKLIKEGDGAELKCIQDSKDGKGALVQVHDFLKTKPGDCGSSLMRLYDEGRALAKGRFVGK